MLVKRTLSPVVLLLPLALLTAARGAEEKSAPPSLVELHKSGDLFAPKKYPAVRAAFSALFEKKHAEAIKEAYGAEHAALTSWLEKHPDIKEELYTAIDGRFDNVVAALALFAKLWKEFPKKVEEYPALAIATAVVWDNPAAVYDYGRHQRRTKSKMPTALADGRANFEYLVNADRTITGNLKALPREFLAFVVDNRTPAAERKWAQGFVKSQRGTASWHQSVPYDKGMLQTEQTGKGPGPKLAGQEYTLPNIKKYGGVCAQQADFVARVGKSLGQPSVYVAGESAFRGWHAWVMWVTVLKGKTARDGVRFVLVSDGRTRGFEKDAFYVGYLTDPQTGRLMLDRDMERRLSVVGYGARLRRQTALAMRAYPALAAEQKFDTKQRLEFLERVWKMSPYAEEAWGEFARLAKAGQLTGEHKAAISSKHALLMRTFAKWPDFIARISGHVVAAEESPAARVKYLKPEVALYERMKRPDLACGASLKVAAALRELKKAREAALELSRAVRKFPAEGRYVPKLLKAYGEVCGDYPAGKAALAKLYLDLTPALIRHYKGEKNRFLDAVIRQGTEFLEGSMLKRQAAQFRAITARARSGS